MERAASDVGLNGNRDRRGQQHPLTRRSTDMQSSPSPPTERFDGDTAFDGDPMRPTQPRLLDLLDSVNENRSQGRGRTVTERGAHSSASSRLKRVTGIPNIAAACDRTDEEVVNRAASTAVSRGRQGSTSTVEQVETVDASDQILSTRNRSGTGDVTEQESRSPADRFAMEIQRRNVNETTSLADQRRLSSGSDDSVSLPSTTKFATRQQTNAGRTVEDWTSEESLSVPPKMTSAMRRKTTGAASVKSSSLSSGIISISDADRFEHQNQSRFGARSKTNPTLTMTNSRIPRGPVNLSSVEDERRLGDEIGDVDDIDEWTTDGNVTRVLMKCFRTCSGEIIEERQISSTRNRSGTGDVTEQESRSPADFISTSKTFTAGDIFQLHETRRPTTQVPNTRATLLRQTASVATIRPPEVARTMLRGSESEAHAPSTCVNDYSRSRRRPGDVIEQRRRLLQSSGDGSEDEDRPRQLMSHGHRNLQHQHLGDFAEFTSPRPTRTRVSSRDLDQTIFDLGRFYRSSTTEPATNGTSSPTPGIEGVKSSVYKSQHPSPTISSSTSKAPPLTTRKNVRFDVSGIGPAQNSVSSHRKAPVDKQRRSSVDPLHPPMHQEERRPTRSHDPPRRREQRTPMLLTPRDAGRITLSFASRVSSMILRFLAFFLTTCVPYCYDELVTRCLPAAFHPIAQEPAFLEGCRFARRWYHVITDSWSSFFDFVLGVLFFCSLIYLFYLFLASL